MKARGRVFKYGDNVDTDVIIPARYLNTSDPQELAKHCMEDIDSTFAQKYKKEISLLPIKTLAVALQGNMHLLQLKRQEYLALLQVPLRNILS